MKYVRDREGARGEGPSKTKRFKKDRGLRGQCRRVEGLKLQRETENEEKIGGGYYEKGEVE